MREAACIFCVALGLAALPASAANEAPSAPPDDLDALSLADKAPTTAVQTAKWWHLYLEGAGTTQRLNAAQTRAEAARASVDLRVDASLAAGWRVVFSNRLDLVNNNADSPTESVNTVREAYLSWARSEDQILDFGRVNVRHGAALGFNPTDWFKEGALRGVVSPDPAALRENRQGTVVLRGQQLWPAGGATLTLSPRLDRERYTDTVVRDAGATNPRHRWLLAGSMKLAEGLAPEMLLHGGEGMKPQLGMNLSALAGDAVVVFGEVAVGKGRSLVAQALQRPEAETWQRRLALGLTYTTAFNLSATAEAEYNSAAPDRQQWRALTGLSPAASLQLLGTAATLQDLPVRQAAFFYLIWKDALVRRFDLSAFVRHEFNTHSRSQWLEARRRWDDFDLALQFLVQSGDTGSVYRTLPLRQSVELTLRYYLQ